MTWLERLARSAGRFDFYVALRRFEASRPSAPRLGNAERPDDEPLRVGQTPSAAFQGAEVTGFTPRGPGGKAGLTVGFFGLWGPHGPLPGHMTEYAHERLKHAGDATLVGFADIFHHRLLLLFYRAWARTQPTVAMDRPEGEAFGRYVGALMGLGSAATRNRGGTHDFTKLCYAPVFASSSRGPDGLKAILHDYFDLPVEIEEFVGEWLDVPNDCRWQLGRDAETGSLGRATLGQRVFSRVQKFRVVLGPLDASRFEHMLPGSPAVDALASLVRLYTHDEWAWELRLVLSPSANQPMRLGSAARLGWTTRIGFGPPPDFDLVCDPVTRVTRRIPKRWVRRPTSLTPRI